MKMKLGVLALIASMSCGASLAQNNPFAGQTPVKVELKKSFGSKDKVGMEITVVTYQDVTLGTTVLPKGSTIVGHIVDANKHSKDNPNGSVAVLFDSAKPKKGDPIAISASVYKLLPADDSGQRTDTASGMRGSSGEMMGAATNRQAIDANSKVVEGMISPSSAPIQVVSYLPGVGLSAVASSTKSGVMANKNDDVTLLAGIYMVIGVAPASK